MSPMIDPLTALAFSIYENKGVYCLLLGSGVSRPSEIPTGWEITLDLVRRVAALHGVTEEPDWATWYKATFGAEPKYSELLDQLASTADERRSLCTAILSRLLTILLPAGKPLPAPTRQSREWLRPVMCGSLSRPTSTA